MTRTSIEHGAMRMDKSWLHIKSITYSEHISTLIHIYENIGIGKEEHVLRKGDFVPHFVRWGAIDHLRSGLLGFVGRGTSHTGVHAIVGVLHGTKAPQWGCSSSSLQYSGLMNQTGRGRGGGWTGRSPDKCQVVTSGGEVDFEQAHPIPWGYFSITWMDHTIPRIAVLSHLPLIDGKECDSSWRLSLERNCARRFENLQVKKWWDRLVVWLSVWGMTVVVDLIQRKGYFHALIGVWGVTIQYAICPCGLPVPPIVFICVRDELEGWPKGWRRFGEFTESSSLTPNCVQLVSKSEPKSKRLEETLPIW